MYKYDLSVIIPCHNVEPYIQLLLDSFKNQIVKNYKIEYIFVLDSCSDDTRGRIKSNNLENVTLIECNVKSVGLARNIGTLLAQGKYIWYIDGDDWLLENNIFLNILNYFSKHEDVNIIRVDWATTPLWPGIKDNKAMAPMMWQFIIKHDFILENDLKFSGIQPGEDLEYLNKVIEILNKYNFELPLYNRKVYFYNYGRINSNMNQFQKNGKIEM